MSITAFLFILSLIFIAFFLGYVHGIGQEAPYVS